MISGFQVWFLVIQVNNVILCEIIVVTLVMMMMVNSVHCAHAAVGVLSRIILVLEVLELSVHHGFGPFGWGSNTWINLWCLVWKSMFIIICMKGSQYWQYDCFHASILVENYIKILHEQIWSCVLSFLLQLLKLLS